MRKIENIWRFVLEAYIDSKRSVFTQQEIAKTLGVSTSTVYHALKIPRGAGAIRVPGKKFEIADAEKLLHIWATYRNLNKDIVYETRVERPIRELESIVPPGSIFTSYSAYRLRFQEAPADYDNMYIYCPDLAIARDRYPQKKGHPNIHILKWDPSLVPFGGIVPQSQLWVDLWNCPEWYSRDYSNALKEKLLGILA